MMMAITVKFVGVFRHFLGAGELALNCKIYTSISELIIGLNEKLVKTKLNLIEQLDVKRPNALILVNGREISVLNGLKTKLKDGDEIVFIPYVHGG
jgi:MoaD family protein